MGDSKMRKYLFIYLFVFFLIIPQIPTEKQDFIFKNVPFFEIFSPKLVDFLFPTITSAVIYLNYKLYICFIYYNTFLKYISMSNITDLVRVDKIYQVKNKD